MNKHQFSVVDEDIPEELYRQIQQLVPILCVDVVVVGKDKTGERMFLLLRRGNEPEKDMWWFPGGRVYKNEKLRDAAMRKVKTETGLASSSLRRLGLYEYFSPVGYYENSNTHTPVVVFLAEVSMIVEITIDSQSTDNKWFTAVDQQWHPYIKRFLRKAGFR